MKKYYQSSIEFIMSDNDKDYLSSLWSKNFNTNLYGPTFARIQIFLIGFLIYASDEDTRQEILFLMAISSLIFARK